MALQNKMHDRIKDQNDPRIQKHKGKANSNDKCKILSFFKKFLSQWHRYKDRENLVWQKYMGKAGDIKLSFKNWSQTQYEFSGQPGVEQLSGRILGRCGFLG